MQSSSLHRFRALTKFSQRIEQWTGSYVNFPPYHLPKPNFTNMTIAHKTTILFILQEDSVLLWKMICSNKLLAHVELVLFLNKCDILEKKLERGVRLARYVRSFQDRANDAETVQKCVWFFFLLSSTIYYLTLLVCLFIPAYTLLILFSLFVADFKAKFAAIQREYSPNPRKFYGFCTSVTVRLFHLIVSTFLFNPFWLMISPHTHENRKLRLRRESLRACAIWLSANISSVANSFEWKKDWERNEDL